MVTPITSPLPDTKTWVDLNSACLNHFGFDAKRIAVGTVLDDIDKGALRLLPPNAVKAVATLIGDPNDSDVEQVAKAIIEIVIDRLT